MFNSITGHLGIGAERQERIPTSGFPWVWVGFLFAFAFFVVEVVFVILTFDEEIGSAAGMSLALGLLGLPGIIYWMFCVHRIHKILEEMTYGQYPISPLEGAPQALDSLL